MEPLLSEAAQKLKVQMEALRRLDAIDRDLLTQRKRIAELEAQSRAAASGLEERRREQEQLRQALEEVVRERREAERTAKERQEQIGKLGGQLYEVKTNEAYSTLQQEIKQKKQEQGLLEERILELMMLEDERNHAIAEGAQALRAEEQKIAALQARDREAVAALAQEIAGLEARWREASAAVERDLLTRYVRIRDAKGGLAMAKIENEICTGCRLSIRPQAIIELMKYRTILFCEHCARILYLD